MSEQDYLDAAYKELRGGNRKEGLWLACLKEENGNESMAAGRYVIERAKEIELSKIKKSDVHENINLSFSAIGPIKENTELCNKLENEMEVIEKIKNNIFFKIVKWVAEFVIGSLVIGFILSLLFAPHPLAFWIGLNVLLGNEERAERIVESLPIWQVVKSRTSRYQDAGKDHFLDTQTGIVWVKKVMPLDHAERFVERNKNYRLPSLKELSSLMECERFTQKLPLELIDYQYFKKTAFVHNGKCLQGLSKSFKTEILKGYDGDLMSFETYYDFNSRVWGVSTKDGGAALYERYQKNLKTMLVVANNKL